MPFEGDHRVLRNWMKKQRLMLAGDPAHLEISTGLMVEGGGMRGVDAGGRVMALQEYQLAPVVDHAQGISAGILAVNYFIGGQAGVGTSIYLEECTQPEFLSLRRLARGHVMDVDWICDKVFQNSPKALDLDAIRRSRTEVRVLVTNVEQARVDRLSLKDFPDMMVPIRATIAMPGISHGNVPIEGVRHCDGGAGAFSIQELVERCTDLLIIANCTRDRRRRPSRLEPALEHYFMREYPVAVRQLFMDRNAHWERQFAYLRSQKKCRWCVFWADGSVGRFTQNSKKLRAAALAAREETLNLLAQASS